MSVTRIWLVWKNSEEFSSVQKLLRILSEKSYSWNRPSSSLFSVNNYRSTTVSRSNKKLSNIFAKVTFSAQYLVRFYHDLFSLLIVKHFITCNFSPWKIKIFHIQHSNRHTWLHFDEVSNSLPSNLVTIEQMVISRVNNTKIARSLASQVYQLWDNRSYSRCNQSR